MTFSQKYDSGHFDHFSFGYHDGAFDAGKGYPNRWATDDHYSAQYRTGYLYGYADGAAKRSLSSKSALIEAIDFEDIQ